MLRSPLKFNTVPTFLCFISCFSYNVLDREDFSMLLHAVAIYLSIRCSFVRQIPRCLTEIFSFKRKEFVALACNRLRISLFYAKVYYKLARTQIYSWSLQYFILIIYILLLFYFLFSFISFFLFLSFFFCSYLFFSLFCCCYFGT